MSAEKYKVHISETSFPDGSLGFEAIEIIPPVSRSFAQLICKGAVDYILERGLKEGPEESVVISAYGFCDEGATVNTLLDFEITPTYPSQDSDRELSALRSVIEKVISPSGAAIAKS